MADADVGVERLSAKADAERKGATRMERGGGEGEDGKGGKGRGGRGGGWKEGRKNSCLMIF